MSRLPGALKGIPLGVSMSPRLRSNVCTWLINQAPEGIVNVDVKLEEHTRTDGVFAHGSTLLLLSMPTMLWNTLPENEAYSFIDVIKSSNLIL